MTMFELTIILFYFKIKIEVFDLLQNIPIPQKETRLLFLIYEYFEIDIFVCFGVVNERKKTPAELNKMSQCTIYTNCVIFPMNE